MRIKKFRRRRSLFQKAKRLFSTRKKKFSFTKFILWSGGSVLALLFLYGTFFLPSVKDAEVLSFAESTLIYDRGALEALENDPQADLTNHILYTIHGDENRDYLPLEDISPWMAKATMAIEDERFYRHFGFDIFGLTNAVLGQIGLRQARGGSTITQQLVKNTFLTRERTFTRKFKELLLAIKMEWHFSKDEIMELYLNKIPYGHNAHGSEAAAKTFFGKSARDLSLAEASILASLPKAPTKFSPYGSNKDLLLGYYEYDESTGERIYKKGRKDLVLQRMLDLKMITNKEFQQAFAEAKDLEFKRSTGDIRAPHFVFYVRQQLEEKYGREFLRQGGLQIFTTLDPDIQTAAEETIETKAAHYESTYGAGNVAMVGIENETGEILAYIGGKDFFDEENDGQVDILTSYRQPGSSFKPFVYATGFSEGYAPSTVLFDVETDFGGNYKPQNFDGNFSGPVSVRQALNSSLNIPAVKMAFLAGLSKVMALAEKVGIEIQGDPEQHGVSLGLGVAEVQPLSHINAYQVFAGDGSFVDPLSILEIRDAQGKVLESLDPKAHKHPGIDPEIAALTRHILTDETTRPVTDGFDWNKLLEVEGYNAGAKTGTSNRLLPNPDFNKDEPESKDNPKKVRAPSDSWTIGFTPNLVAGVWVGNNRGKPMVSGATGLTVAAPVWKGFMTKAHEILAEQDPAVKDKLYNEPTPLEVRSVNKFSGKLSQDSTPPKLVTSEVFASFGIPAEIDDSVKIIEVDKLSGRPANRFTPYYAKIQKHSLDLTSIRPDLPHWENPVQEWLEDHPKFLTSLGVILEAIEDDELESQNPVSRLRNLRDDVHNAFTNNHPPEIKILSPSQQGQVARGKVEVKVAATAKFGMKAVEFYLDDQLVDDSTRYPFTGHFNIPPTVDIGTKHTLRVIAIDRLLNFSQQEITITIASDGKGPEINFLGPIGNQKIPLNSEVDILVDVRDANSAPKTVEFYLDDQLLTSVDKAPYQTKFRTSGKLGRHYLKVKASDEHGNINEKSLPVIFERESLITQTSPAIDKVTKYRNSVAIDLLFPEPDSVEYSQLILTANGEAVFQQKLEAVTKTHQIQVPRGITQGRIKIELFTQIRDVAEPHEASPKSIDL